MKSSCLPAICFALCLVGMASSEKTSANLKPEATQSPSGTPPALCQLPPETGICKAIFHRFFYNATSDECEQFIYGGCQGNANNFETTELCVRVCRPLVTDTPAKKGADRQLH
ncbi:colostrum trypsin inhibitor-like [Manis pentadactyla]|uniref:colostrum trypsin inhibitor-like n=1 Tax=Manis pentadactyla TaxID=143292 RepID=UPI00255CE001|nr:colostrum trypsin inhibitor-like [Manis pentadactyla]